jgi:DNA-binding MarR family transcriptional regulator
MAELDPIIHQPVRLKISASLASLNTGDSMDFTFLRDLLELTDGNLGAHIRKLEDAGYLNVDKAFIERKPKTFVALTDKGRRALREHVKALNDILEDAS